MNLTDALALARAAVADLGVRRTRLRWVVTEPVALTTPVANALRGALGAALYEAGAAQAYALAWDGAGPAALWFHGWHGACLDAGAHLEADLVLLGACGDHWPALLAGLGSLRVATGRLRLQDVSWAGGGAGWDWPAGAALGLPAVPQQGPVVVETITPLHLRQGEQLLRVPPLAALVRSAGDRLRKLSDRWVGVDRDLTVAVGMLVRTSAVVPVALVRPRLVSATRRGTQPIDGIVGAWRYDDCGPPAGLLGVGQLLGVGKGTAFGCGALRLGDERWTS
ncbi:MAG: CRISPR system precrRNA processing endoribonuclease RAMP protein Cas6 [Egibacteraceae bacterium]